MTEADSSAPMTVLIDAVNAGFGGIATYVNNLIRLWPTLYPRDTVHLLAPPVVAAAFAGLPVTVHELHIPRPAVAGRPFAQTRAMRRLTADLQPDAVLATLPSTTLLRLAAPMVVTIYDLRHELRPEQFTRQRRVLRRLSYGRGYRLADGFVSISARSLNDLHRLHPRTARVPGAVVHLAADHVDGWPGRADGDYAVAFGHHSNKNVDLLLDAWQILASAARVSGVPPLHLTGVSGAARDRVAEGVRSRGLNEHVTLLPFLDEAKFQALFAGSRLVVFPSDFEGFGLPVIEAMRLRKPIVVGPDEAVLEVAGGHATVMAGWTSEALAAAVDAALGRTEAELNAAEAHAAGFTWERVTRETRAELVARTVAGAANDAPQLA